jgi:hypothetical protein
MITKKYIHPGGKAWITLLIVPQKPSIAQIAFSSYPVGRTFEIIDLANNQYGKCPL